MEEQIKIFPKNKNILTIDHCFKEQSSAYFPLSRKFILSGNQKKSVGFIKRPFESLSVIDKEKEFVLCDDDCATGETINKAKELLKKQGVKISSCYIALDEFLLHKNINKDEVYDCVDLRDFLLGSYQGGLVVSVGNKVYRVPYIFPWVTLIKRAKLPSEKSIQFSLDVLEANIIFLKV